MNRTMSEQNRPGRETCGHVLWQAVGILVAAVVMSIVYRQTCLLGVRKASPPGEPFTLHRSAVPLASALPVTAPPGGANSSPSGQFTNGDIPKRLNQQAKGRVEVVA